ncbi:anti-sigma factor [Actinoallomurus spadix]|uniref:Regulator of SigK n=1 Tax=Actinoallomurus spadix TaxID=79912 RepID=A0ABP3FLF3_9ACTN|nr:anti-sigma factor [Actinoallomurus spadix]MCO5985835.1 anti-sigma factor [Actinoallomurus spadix]
MADDIHTLAGPYALGALTDDAEREAFEDHLAQCAFCAEEIDGLLATSAVLGRAVALPPPPDLRARVLGEIADTPQEQAAHPVRRARRLPRPATLLAAACLVVALAAGAVAVRTQQRLSQETARAQAIAAVLSAPDARTVTGRMSSGGTLTVTSSAARKSAVIAPSGLPALPSTKTYELWTMSGSGVRPAGTVQPGSAPVVTSLPAGHDRIGVTVEPAGGSPRPTTTPLAVLTL